jgi:peptidoglycan/xylan/chitin deacetylase (PgdA/CDA1 family)
VSRTARISLVAGALGTLAAAHAVPATTTFGPMRKRLFPGLSGRGDGAHVALTFDDGPDPESTPRFLPVLAALKVTSTFFLLGEMLEAAPDLGRQLVAEGHEVAVHGWTHRSMLLRSPVSAYDGLARTRDLIERTTGSRPRYFRPPYGVLSAAALIAARRAGLQTVLWTGWGEDWTAHASATSVLDTLAPDINGGATLLLHDSDCTSADGAWHSALGALPLVVERCRELGLTVGPLREHGLPVR